MEDLPPNVRSEIEQFAENRNFEQVMIVDTHNAMGKDISKEDSEDLKQLRTLLRNHLLPGLNQCVNEPKSVLKALDGQFISPGPSGSPTRGRIDVLPTGRNF